MIQKMFPRHFTVFTLLVLVTYFLLIRATSESHYGTIKPSESPFEYSLKTLQKQINYNFQNIGLLRRAMTHPSFSEENNRALSVVGVNIIDTFVAMLALGQDIDMSSKDLNRRIAEISNMETCCAADGMQLGLHKVVRVASKTNSTAPPVICGAFRALFGAIAIDTGKSDDAGVIFWSIHNGEIKKALAF